MNKAHDSRIILLQLENGGKARALNVGLDYALGEFVLEMDGDDWLEPDALEVLVTELDKAPKDIGQIYANRKIWFQKGTGIEEGPMYSGRNYKDKYEVLQAMQTHCPRLYRREALDYIGG